MAAAALVLAVAAPAAAQEDPCRRFGPGAEAGTVADPSLTEISGVVASRAHPEVLWVHNDSGGQPEVTALSETGADLGTYAVPGATATDWEDIAAGPGPEPGRSYLYVADIGDNAEARDHVVVYRVPEPEAPPSAADGTLAEPDTIALRYPGGPIDAEALLVDPVRGDLVVVGKRDAAAPVFMAEADALRDGADVTLRQVATLAASPVSGPPAPVGLVTGGDVSPDGSVVLLRTYLTVLAYARPSDGPLAAAFEAPPCAAPQVSEQQGEAIAFAADGSSYATVSEGVQPPVHRFAVSPPLAATTTTTTTTAPAPPAEETEDGVPAWAWAAGIAGAALVLALVVLAVRRRQR